MPRVAEESEIGPSYPWAEWKQQLLDSPTKALVFSQEDFGAISPYAFKKRVMKELGHLGIHASERRGEVLVALNA